MTGTKRRGRRDYKTRIVYSFLSTYIIIALIPIVIGVTFYTYTLRAVSENECEKTSALLSQSVSAMDADFRMARDIMSRFMQSSALNELLVSDSPSSKPSVTMNSMEFCKELKQIYINDSLIYDVLVYLNAPDVLYGARNGYSFTRPNVYYPYFLYMEGFSVEEWQDVLAGARSSYFVPARQAVLEGYDGGRSEERYIGLYVWPLYRDGIARGNVVFLLDASKFTQDMELAIDVEEGALAWAETPDGEVIMSCPADADVTAEADDFLRISVSSRYNQLRYNVLIPRAVVSGKVRWLRDAIILVTALSVLLGAMAAAVFARRLGAPLDRISANLRTLYAPDTYGEPAQPSRRPKPLAELGDSVNELIIKHGKLSSYVSRQINVLDQLFFEKLLGGYFGDEAQVQEMLEHVSQPRLSGPFVLALLRMERTGGDLTVSEASEMSARRAEAFAAELHAQRDMFETSLDSCVLIFSLSESSEEEIERQLRAAIERMNAGGSGALAMRVSGALSLPVGRYIELSRVYARCQELIYSSSGDSAPVLMHQRDMGPQVYSYSLDVENQLINFAMAGNRERVHELILSAFGAERTQGHLGQSQRMLTQSMCATLMRISQMMGGEQGSVAELDDAARRLAVISSSSGALDAILGYFDDIVDKVQSRQRGRTDALIAMVREYVDANYADADLNLASTATHFSLTDAYLSRAFKEYTGSNFSAYLERRRIDRALELIDGPLSLDEIAARTGFEHLYNLRSAFKRTMGVTPSEYRKRAK